MILAVYLCMWSFALCRLSSPRRQYPKVSQIRSDQIGLTYLGSCRRGFLFFLALSIQVVVGFPCCLFLLMSLVWSFFLLSSFSFSL